MALVLETGSRAQGAGGSWEMSRNEQWIMENFRLEVHEEAGLKMKRHGKKTQDSKQWKSATQR